MVLNQGDSKRSHPQLTHLTPAPPLSLLVGFVHGSTVIMYDGNGHSFVGLLGAVKDVARSRQGHWEWVRDIAA